MRTLVDIPDKQLSELRRIGQAKKQPRAALIREAIDNYVAVNRSKSKAIDEAFGLWRGKNIDSLEYQRKLRDEW
jgi:metal-responsive CopG/Arc/MetJ family transcriptional regulator